MPLSHRSICLWCFGSPDVVISLVLCSFRSLVPLELRYPFCATLRLDNPPVRTRIQTLRYATERVKHRRLHATTPMAHLCLVAELLHEYDDNYLKPGPIFDLLLWLYHQTSNLLVASWSDGPDLCSTSHQRVYLSSRYTTQFCRQGGAFDGERLYRRAIEP